MYFLIPFLGLLIADQAVKHLVRTTMVQGQSIPIIENIFHITSSKIPAPLLAFWPTSACCF